MKKLWKNSLLFWKIISISVLGIILLCSCDNSELPEISSLNNNLPTKQADSVRIVTTFKNKIEEVMTAVHFDEYSNGLVIAKTVFIENYNPDGSLKYTLSCDEAEVDDTKNMLTAIGNVVVTSDNGVLKTPFLEFNQKTEQIAAKNGVILIRKENTLNGKELKTDINFDEIEIIQVSAEGKIEEENIDW